MPTTIEVSATKLEYYIHNGDVLSGPADPEHVTCKSDPGGAWDYLCTDDSDGQVWGFNVNHSAVTRSGLLTGAYQVGQ